MFDISLKEGFENALKIIMWTNWYYFVPQNLKDASTFFVDEQTTVLPVYIACYMFIIV